MQYVIGLLIGLLVISNSLQAQSIELLPFHFHFHCERPYESCTSKTPNVFQAVINGIYLKSSNISQGLIRNSRNWRYTNIRHKIPALKQPLSRHYQPQPVLTIRYSHTDNDFHGNSSSAKNSLFSGNDVSPDITAPLITNTPSDSDSSTRYTLERIDLKLAKEYVDAANVFSLQHKLGLRYLSFENHLQLSRLGVVSNEYRGIGPAIGSIGHVALSKHYGLVGGIEYAAILSDAQPNVVLTSDHSFKADHIVSNIIGKVGVDYRYDLGNQRYASIEAGFQINHYLNFDDLLKGNFAANQPILGVETNAIAFNGPYATLTIHL